MEKLNRIISWVVVILCLGWTVLITVFMVNDRKHKNTTYIISNKDTVVVTGRFNIDLSKLSLNNSKYVHGHNDTTIGITSITIIQK